ncbi:MAG: FUSC family protein [Spirochaetaceae bacterium]|jgi:uncharacterized membrane protein YgaE (UPF0421/DUF939 family)|nr:FUSC family protein [Spirochaetaceae bacterium]
MEKNKNKVVLLNKTDVEIALASGICLSLAGLIPEFQAMTACIATLLCVQEGLKPSLKAGMVRLIVTAVGGLIGILVVLADVYAANHWVFIFLIMIGLVLTLFGCKLAGTPAFNARIGGVTFILVVLTKTGTDRIAYALFRLLSTLYGVAVVLIVTAVFSFFHMKRAIGPNEKKEQ